MIVRSLGFLEDTFGSPPASVPFIASSIIPAERSFSTGDVTDNAMIGLRFMGTAPDPTAPGALASTRSIILHEGVHFWNGGVARFAQDTPMWLHEGGAEYIATISSYRLGWSDREHLQNTFGSWLDRCSTSLGWSNEVALNELDFIPSSLRYSCGPLLHFLAELYLGEDGDGPGITDTWRETIATAAQTDVREYTLADWVEASRDEELLERPALAAILATSGAKRWTTVYSELDRLGVTIGQSTNPPLRARTALMFFIRSQCTGLGPGEGYGFYSGQQSYRLDTPEGCGLVTGNPVVETLAGFPITMLSAEEYAHMQSICAAGGTIAFGLAGGDAVEVPCPGPLAEADTTPSITALPDIPAFAR